MNSSLCEFQKTQLVIISNFMEAIFHVQTSSWQGSFLNKVSWTTDAIGKSQVRWTFCKVWARWGKNRYGMLVMISEWVISGAWWQVRI